MTTDVTKSEQKPSVLSLEPNDVQRLANLCGPFDQHLRLIEKRLNVAIHNRGNQFSIYGKSDAAEVAQSFLQDVFKQTENDTITAEMIHIQLRHAGHEHAPDKSTDSVNDIPVIRTKKEMIKPRGLNQQKYVQSVRRFDINFGVGPAGTGKTYLAVALAVEALLNNEVERILLVRPAVEAGEKLGFLPGDLAQKIDPYLRPLYDALYEMLGVETVNKLIERQVIEIAPLAYMRGRTLNSSYIILDESQNTTRAQMKMFLTRIGFGSTAVITGDMSQIDLPRGTQSGLVHVSRVLRDVDGISFTYFASADVVRHPLVQRIVDAYDEFEANDPSEQSKLNER
ncbi:MAG: PhoH family protein [Pseudomonadales bacterium]